MERNGSGPGSLGCPVDQVEGAGRAVVTAGLSQRCAKSNLVDLCCVGCRGRDSG